MHTTPRKINPSKKTKRSERTFMDAEREHVLKTVTRLRARRQAAKARLVEAELCLEQARCPNGDPLTLEVLCQLERELRSAKVELEATAKLLRAVEPKARAMMRG